MPCTCSLASGGIGEVQFQVVFTCLAGYVVVLCLVQGQVGQVYLRVCGLLTWTDAGEE